MLSGDATAKPGGGASVATNLEQCCYKPSTWVLQKLPGGAAKASGWS
jgi:hypothetical protein